MAAANWHEPTRQPLASSDIQQLLGHENLETTAIYTQVSVERLKAVHACSHPAQNP